MLDSSRRWSNSGVKLRTTVRTKTLSEMKTLIGSERNLGGNVTSYVPKDYCVDSNSGSDGDFRWVIAGRRLLLYNGSRGACWAHTSSWWLPMALWPSLGRAVSPPRYGGTYFSLPSACATIVVNCSVRSRKHPDGVVRENWNVWNVLPVVCCLPQ